MATTGLMQQTEGYQERVDVCSCVSLWNKSKKIIIFIISPIECFGKTQRKENYKYVSIVLKKPLQC